ncbi:MAG: hypothetical protein IK144_13280 [Bacteroidaceae bacterium]|nr:hypothetical protein [Bacteroidaceae bacterium]
MGLTLHITPKEATTPLAMTFGFDTNTNATITLSSTTYTLSLDSLSFNKQMYQPGEINARIQISPVLDWSTLQDKFLKSKVFLFRGTDSSKQNIATDYYVHELIPEYLTSALYVEFKIYSPDKLLTLKSDCQVFVSQRLGQDILKNEVQATPPNNADAETKEIINEINSKLKDKVKVCLQNNLGYGSNKEKEYIQPYLVQYNESFYDILIRTANRWGEFIYYEGGNFILGRDVPTSNEKLSNYVSVSYVKAMENKTTSDNCTKAVTTDDYLAAINKSSSKSDYIQQAGDMIAGDAVYHHKVVQSFFNMKGNIFDWTLNTLIDDGIKAAQNDKILTDKEKDYNEKFFTKPFEADSKNATLNTAGELLEIAKLHYDDTDSSKVKKCRQFATYENNGGLTVANYKKVAKWELMAGNETVCVDMDDSDSTYQHLRLGDVFYLGTATTTLYLVTRVECMVDDAEELVTETAETVIGNKIGNVITSVEIKHTKSLHYRVYAIKQVNTAEKAEDDPVYEFYPPMLPTGHIRFSGPQRAFIKDTFDPMMNSRYRVQTFGSAQSPWLRVSRDMVAEKSGAVWQMKEGTEVLLDFDDGNVELPYIVGALQKQEKGENNRATMFNTMDFTTPSGHAIRLSDGAGGGAANFAASFIPIVSLIKDFYPDKSGLPDYGGYSKYYEGGMELTDKFGIYSIKASTDKRNISISSPYGDVNLNAFTGITISAPNGDVKIQGKNVSIEAGNKISITSGKNIVQGLFGSGLLAGGDRGCNGWATISDVCNAAGKKVANWFDLSIVRNTLEIVFRPIRGSLEIKSYRNMLLQAGIYRKDNSEFMRINETKAGTWWKWISTNYSASNLFYDFTDRFCDQDKDKDSTWRAPCYGTIITKCVNSNDAEVTSQDVFGSYDADINKDVREALSEFFSNIIKKITKKTEDDPEGDSQLI